MPESNIPENVLQIKSMFDEISNKLNETNKNIINLSNALTNVKTHIASSITNLNINLDRLNKTFETIFQLTEIEEAKKTLLNLIATLEEEFDKKNVSNMISELIQAILKLSKQETPEE